VLEVIGIIWVYGLGNLISDIEFMLGRKMGWYWKICWSGIIPVGLSVILIYSLIVAETVSYSPTVPYPTSAVGTFKNSNLLSIYLKLTQNLNL